MIFPLGAGGVQDPGSGGELWVPTKARPELLVTPWLSPRGRDPGVFCHSPSELCPLSQTVINTMCGHGMQARGYLEASAFIHTNGCIDKLVNWTHSNLFLLGGITLGLALPQVRGPGTGGRRLHPKALLCGLLGELPAVADCEMGELG